MRGAQALIGALVECGVGVCFANPGTSEMHFVSCLDSAPEMRGVLGLFEGVCTGAADGYGRMAGRPACTLLHLGPGLANGLANLHNARRARSPVVNVVGDHATAHQRYDAPLQSDIESLARPMSDWYRSSASPDQVAGDAADAVAAALGPPSTVATLVLPADVSWSEVQTASPGRGGLPAGVPAGTAVPHDRIAAVATVLGGSGPVAILLGGRTLRRPGLMAAARVAATTGAKLFCETFPGRVERGAGIPEVERIAYFAEMAAAQLDGIVHLVTIDAKVPVSPFAYPDRPSEVVPDGCSVHDLAGASEDALGALVELAERFPPAGIETGIAPARAEGRPSGALTPETAAAVIGALMPEGAVVSDEANTSGLHLPRATACAPRHDWLTLSGNAIGQGLPLATGAAVACRDRPVLALVADGSAMYTIQALWTQAREALDVTTVIFDNGSYAILNFELQRVGAEPPGPKARDLLDLSRPDIDFTALARAMGVPAARASTAEELATELERGLAEPGPHLVQAMLARR